MKKKLQSAGCRKMYEKNIEVCSMPGLTSTFKYYLENIIKFIAKIGKQMLIKIVSIYGNDKNEYCIKWCSCKKYTDALQN